MATPLRDRLEEIWNDQERVKQELLDVVANTSDEDVIRHLKLAAKSLDEAQDRLDSVINPQ